ncbi:efflux RND transporter periplasmic adaptor subunit [Mastigocoleus testarum]|uniref:efflux RND transporter periplasmic adaptor subunit n=1 Tax=Mastigocoleus testarum TaxID=996925 RepID=UPI0003FD75D9|nr:efflux RND transporter periplasmic adaptor subunit [Mastigocoleus testarum]
MDALDTDQTREVFEQPPALQKKNTTAGNKRKLMLRGLIGSFIFLGGLGLIFTFRNIHSSAEKQVEVVTRTQTLRVKTLIVKPVQSYEVSRTYTGEVAALRASELGFERSGKLVELFVDEGDRVTKGNPLAKLDTSNLKTQRLRLLAEKAQAKARLEELEAGPRQESIAAARAAVLNLEKQTQLERIKRSRRESLYKEGAISREQLDEVAFNAEAIAARLLEARSNLEELLNGTRREQILAQRAVVKQLEANISDLEINIAKSTLKAPFSGTIATGKLDEGVVINAGQSVIRLVENARPEVRIGVPVSIVPQLKNKNGFSRVEIGGRTYQGKISSFLPEIDSRTRTQTVVLRLEPSSLGTVTPGQTARWQITDKVAQEGYWIPKKALVKGLRGLWSCYALVEADREASVSEEKTFRLKEQTVEILHQDGERVLVRGTLSPGDMVVADGVHRLVPNQLVRRVEEL